MILVTGGSGYLGSHLAKRLLDMGENVRILDLVEPSEGLSDRVEFVRGDVRDYDTVLQSCRGVRAVYHTAASVPVSKAGEGFKEVNVDGTRNLLDAVVQLGEAPQFIHISSSAIYGVPETNPINEESPLTPLGAYGESKLEAERLCHTYSSTHGLHICVLRPRGILGGAMRLGIFGILFDWVRAGKRIYLIGEGDNCYQFINIQDLVDACILARSENVSGVFCLGSDDFVSVKELMGGLIDYAGTGARIAPINKTVARNALKALDWLNLSPLVGWHYLGGGEDFYYDCSKAKRVMGWQPKHRDMESLIESYQWFVDHYEEGSDIRGVTHRQMPNQRLLGILKWIS
ncbi:MAG: NAD(P)-dependent oxidoreductase [Candidatus Bathyarchaeota archaeon]|jgi:nucleoside-diphosphate-sugar epimerase